MMHHDILYTPDDINAVNKIVTNGVDLQMAGNNIRTIYCKHGKNNDSSLLLIKNVMPIISYNDFDKINPATYQ